MIYLSAARLIADRNREEGEFIGITNGCFDLFHPGHVAFLRACAEQCSFLLVGINTDASVKANKGPSRPIMTESERLVTVQSCRFVGQAFLFPELTFANCITEIRPHVWFKGSDYSAGTLAKDEVEAANAVRARVCILPSSDPTRTSSIIDRILAAERAKASMSDHDPRAV